MVAEDKKKGTHHVHVPEERYTARLSRSSID